MLRKIAPLVRAVVRPTTVLPVARSRLAAAGMPMRTLAVAAGATASAGSSTGVVQFNEKTQDLKTIINKPDANVILYFTASWCGPCRAIAPKFTELEGLHGSKVQFIKIDVDENDGTASSAGIRAVPTFMAYAKGKKVREFSGANLETLKTAVEELAK